MAGKINKGTGERQGRPVARVKPGDRIDRLDRRAVPPGKGGGGKGGSGRRLTGRRILYWLAVGGLWAGIALGVVIAFFAWDLPSMDRLHVIDRRPAVRLVAADGTTFATVGDLYGEALPLEQYPDVLVKAVLAIEDRRFFDHGGFDPIGILRAMFNNIADGRLSQGGSTISQQTAKTIFLSPERTMRRKVQEALLTLQLESRLNKQQILALYLNRVYLGAGAYGMDGAARRYFGHSAREMTLAEAAMLAGLMKAPSRYSPLADYKAASDRAAVVLQAMVDADFITEDQAAAARALPARLAARPASNDARYFVDWVVEQVADYAGPEAGDLIVSTTLDLKLQRAAETALDNALNGDGLKLDAEQGALVAMAPDGAVRAMIGGRDYAASPFNRATRALRQPGSAFKLFVYLAALEAGLTPDTTMVDAPVEIAGYRPSNLDPGYAGEMTLTTAFARSVNTIAVRLLARVGARKVVEMARRLGITSDIPPNASIALGSAEVTPLELTAAYGVMASGGRAVLAHGIREIRTADGTVLYRRDAGATARIVSQQVVGRMNRLLAAVINGGTGKAARLTRPAGGKTGTSQDYRNAWFVGFSADLVAAVWVGNDDGTPMKKVTGGGLPAQIWKAFMTEALQGAPATPLPDMQEDRDLLDQLVDFLGGEEPAPEPAPAEGQPAPAPGPPVRVVPDYPVDRKR